MNEPTPTPAAPAKPTRLCEISTADIAARFVQGLIGARGSLHGARQLVFALVHQLRVEFAEALAEPIPMLLWCPHCHEQHVDRPDAAKGWTNPPHKSHLCHACGCIWRPADVPTTGVRRIATKGKADTLVTSAEIEDQALAACGGDPFGPDAEGGAMKSHHHVTDNEIRELSARSDRTRAAGIRVSPYVIGEICRRLLWAEKQVEAAAEAVKAEREACAALVDEYVEGTTKAWLEKYPNGCTLAAAIRARQ